MHKSYREVCSTQVRLNRWVQGMLQESKHLWIHAGPKSPRRIIEKIQERNNASSSTITDLARGSIVLMSPHNVESMDAFLVYNQHASPFQCCYDARNKTTNTTIRKRVVRDRLNGVYAEIQFHTCQSFWYYHILTHPEYEVRRRPYVSDECRLCLEEVSTRQKVPDSTVCMNVLKSLLNIDGTLRLNTFHDDDVDDNNNSET